MDPLMDLAISDAMAQNEDETVEEAPEEYITEETSVVEQTNTTTLTSTVPTSVSAHVDRHYPSLYDSYGTTFVAIVLAVLIISSVIGIVTYIYRKAKTDHAALTQFVTTMFALIAGVFIADKIIAGPSTSLLSEQEALKVLDFIQQTCLMVFAYYFGTKAQPPKEEPPNME
jgi:hypothetical protein